MSKIIMLLIGVVTFVLCQFPGGPTYLFAFANCWLVPPAILLGLGAIWPRFNGRGALWGAVCGMATMAVFTLLDLTKVFSINSYVYLATLGLVVTLVVAELVEDGATIQLGFGGTINALAAELKDKRGLGIHTEAMTDAAMELLRCGAADNSRKSLHRGKTVTCFTMGSHALYDFVDDNPTILHKALSYTNDLSVLAANRGMTSINAALQVDLTGQCASESVGPRQISGSGGQVDTAGGAQMAPGGKSVITLRSTYSAKDPDTGERRLQSRILPVLPEGAVVTLTRSNTHFVATEYGAVCLRGLTVPQPVSYTHLTLPTICSV